MGIQTPTIRFMTIPIIEKEWEFRPQATDNYHEVN